MVDSDGRLAPVTYLFGATPPAELPTMASVFGEKTRDAPADDRAAAGIDRDSDREADADREADDDREAGDDGDPRSGSRGKASRIENVSMHALTRRGVSRRELERTLRDRDFDDDAVEAELERLEGVGLIDDLALAQQLVATLQERKGYGSSAITGELTRRLLSPAAIEYARDLIDSGDELARAREIALKRASQLRSYDRETAVRRLSAYLARRGYSGSTVRSAVDAALPPTGSGGPRFR